MYEKCRLVAGGGHDTKVVAPGTGCAETGVQLNGEGRVAACAAIGFDAR
jgi:hypothetical protein